MPTADHALAPPASASAPPYLAALVPAVRRAAPVLPIVAVVALLALPVPAGVSGDGPQITVADVASGLVVALCVLTAVRSARRPLTRAAALLFGLPVVGVTAAACAAPTGGAALAGAARYLQIFVLVPLAVLALLRDGRDVRLVAWAFVGLAGWQGALGVHQYVTGTGASYMGEDIRAVGTFGPTDVMGMATVVSFGVVCALALAFRDGAPRQRAAALACAALLLVPLALSFSRGAWIATAAACGAVLVLAGVRRALRVLLAATAAAVVLVGGFGVGSQMLQQRLGSITEVADAPDQSVTDRYTMWAASLDMWRERPVTGVGLKGFPEYRDSHASVALSSGSDTAGAGHGFTRQPLLSPHNMYLLILSEQGLLGLCALAGCWVGLLACGLRRWARTRALPPAAPGDRLDCALLACGLLVWQLVDFLYADIGGPSTVLTAIVLGVAAWWGVGDHTRRREVPAP
ncbi:O-antigen ligase family protein [Streptomyces sp. NPDC053474]|uniref:O-antigen ligase family protein n=1 Tax=Streptomyces sp. NPDC053474 TaxID=3365704 RepID=UPI0037D19384